MARLSIFKGSVDLISGLRPKNNGDFPLMEAHDIVVDESGTRLDEKLEKMGSGGSGGSVELDTTVSVAGKAADAKAVRDLIDETVGNIESIVETI